jgi:hypothetical protein
MLPSRQLNKNPPDAVLFLTIKFFTKTEGAKAWNPQPELGAVALAFSFLVPLVRQMDFRRW